MVAITFDGMIQVAGVIDAAKAELLTDCGATHLGFPLRLPVHREDLSEAAAAEIIRTLPAHCPGVLITYLDRAAEIVEFAATLGVSIVQLHGDVPPAELQRLKQLAPQLAVIKSLVVGLHAADELHRLVADCTPWVEAFITDTFDPATGASGATGKLHNWEISRELVQRSSRPVILAGGLTPENVAAGIHAVRPAGVDAHTGLEDLDGRKSRTKVTRFVSAAKHAFAELWPRQ